MKVCNRLFIDSEGDLKYDPTVEPIQRTYMRTTIAGARSDVVTFLFEDDYAFAEALDRWNRLSNDYRFSEIKGLGVSD